jgi:hypothetical protein
MELNGTSYQSDTSEAVANALEKVRFAHTLVRLFRGDVKTGRSWGDDFMTCGRVSRSCGSIKIPILINNSRSTGGPGILDHCILAIMTSPNCFLYKHPTFSPGEFIECEGVDNRPFGVKNGKGESIANFKTEAKRARWIAFMKGERMRP